MIDEFQLAKALKFPDGKMSNLALKRHMRGLIKEVGIEPHKLNRETWLVHETAVATIEDYLCSPRKDPAPSPQPKERILRTGGYAGRSAARRSSNLQDYLTAV